jgi:hypothetical protein
MGGQAGRYRQTKGPFGSKVSETHGDDHVNDDETLIFGEITNLREAVEAQTAGLMNMLRIQAQQSAVLKEILAACTAEPDGPSPLVKLILKLNEAIEGQTAAIGRIEAALVQPAR